MTSDIHNDEVDNISKSDGNRDSITSNSDKGSTNNLVDGDSCVSE